MTAMPLPHRLRRVVAPNPSPMTGPGTNTYILGHGDVAVIDPGPDAPSHQRAIMATLGPGERVSHILVTHSHLDHSGLARSLARETGAAVLAFGDSLAGRSPRMAALAAAGMTSGEGVDTGFVPDRCVVDGERIGNPRGGWAVTALHTPGHFCNHLCFDWDGHLFSGDVAMGFSTSLVAAPDGDMAAYMASLSRLRHHLSALPTGVGRPMLWPGHGDPVAEAEGRLHDLAAHRLGREAQIIGALTAGPNTPTGIARLVYTDTPPALMAAAALNVHAHLVDLLDRNRVTTPSFPGLDAVFSMA